MSLLKTIWISLSALLFLCGSAISGESATLVNSFVTPIIDIVAGDSANTNTEERYFLSSRRLVRRLVSSGDYFETDQPSDSCAIEERFALLINPTILLAQPNRPLSQQFYPSLHGVRSALHRCILF